MIAHYGYKDGSGSYFIIIDTDKCDGCGKCAEVCPAQVFEVREEDPNDPLRDVPVAAVVEGRRKQLERACGLCKPVESQSSLPCVRACEPGAIDHTW